MTRTHWLVLLSGIWAALYATSVLVPYFTAPTDFGFTRGMNRLTAFVQYQLGAGVVGVFIWAMGQRLHHRWQRWLARVPGLLAIGLVVLVLVAITVANLFEGRAEPATSPQEPTVTQ